MKPKHSLMLLVLLLLYGAAFGQNANTTNVAAATPNELGLRSGPMLGYSELTEVALWVQTTRAARVQFRYWIEGQPGTSHLSAPARTTPEGDHIAQVTLSYLKAGQRYGYELYIDGKLVALPHRLVFQTQAHWQWRTDPPAFTVALGSCAYVNEKEHDRPGEPYGADFDIFPSLSAKQPDLMLWLGDNVYYREPDFFSADFMRHRNAHTRQLPEWQALLAATHHYAIWDDHDYGPNDSDWTYRLKREALEIFKSYWANPAYGLADTPGVFFQFMWADVDFFMLDDRYYRTPDDGPESPDKTMFGKAQLRWLKDALFASHAPFKVVANGSQMLNPQPGGEGFSKFKQEQAELLSWIKTSKINGVLFLSGDVHRTELIRLNDPNFYPLYDYSNSPLTSGTYSADRVAANPSRVEGTLVAGKRNFGLLRFEGPRKERKLTMECYDKTGKLLWKHEVKASELQVK
ncbi:MAG: alkaline phosphatase D family protein [candidate division KSB1 bacterium]